MMMIQEDSYEWLSPEEFRAQAASVLSFLVLLPVNTAQNDLLNMQSWFQDQGLLTFAEPAKRCSNGEGQGVVCKHVHVPGIGPEIDISPSGVNKGSAIAKLLADVRGNLGVDADGTGEQVAVFGDAANDVELFGMRRDATGEALEPLGLGYRPAVRVAMPWANDRLLTADANIISTCDRVFAEISRSSP